MEPTKQFVAVIPAGGPLPDDVALGAGTKYKALLEFNGKTILDSVVDALLESGWIKSVYVTGPECVTDTVKGKIAGAFPDGGSGPENIYRSILGARDATGESKVVLCTSDVPLVRAEHISKFLSLCTGDQDIYVPIVHGNDFDARFPGTPSTYAYLDRQPYTLGSVFLLDANSMEKARPYFQRVFDNRKSVIGLLQVLGVSFAIKYILKRLTVADVENKIKSLLGCTGTAVKGVDAELAFDIDDADDYRDAVAKTSQP